jgi:hypothetical protein
MILKHQKILIWAKEKNILNFFKIAFETQKQTESKTFSSERRIFT